MLRSLCLTLAAMSVAWAHERNLDDKLVAVADQEIRQLIASARGAPAPICALAVNSVGNGWGRWADAPVTPLPRSDRAAANRGRRGRDSVSTEDIQFLFDNLTIEDGCVREMAVRILGGAHGPVVVRGFVERLGSPDSSMRWMVDSR